MPVDAQEHTLEGVSRLQHKGVDTILGECLCKSISPLNKLMSLDRLRVVKKPKILVEIVNGALLNFVEMLGRILVNQACKPVQVLPCFTSSAARMTAAMTIWTNL